MTNKRKRAQELETWTGALEKIIRERREAVNNEISVAHYDFEQFTKFQLEFFVRRVLCYTQHKITRHGFESYMDRQRAITKYIEEEIAPKGCHTLVFYGASLPSPNAPIRG